MHMHLLWCGFAGACSPWDLHGTLLVRVMTLPRAMCTTRTRTTYCAAQLRIPCLHRAVRALSSRTTATHHALKPIATSPCRTRHGRAPRPRNPRRYRIAAKQSGRLEGGPETGSPKGASKRPYQRDHLQQGRAWQVRTSLLQNVAILASWQNRALRSWRKAASRQAAAR